MSTPFDFLELVDAVGAVVKKHSPSYKKMPSKATPFADAGYDSLDCLMLFIYVAEIYGIPEEVTKTLFPTNADELEAAVLRHKTTDPASIAAAMELVK